MKKFQKFLISALAMMLVCSAVLGASALNIGDANDDGGFNIADLVRVKKYIAASQEEKKSFEINADAVDSDMNGILDAVDLTKLKTVLLGTSEYQIITDEFDYLNVTELD